MYIFYAIVVCEYDYFYTSVVYQPCLIHIELQVVYGIKECVMALISSISNDLPLTTLCSFFSDRFFCIAKVMANLTLFGSTVYRKKEK